MKRYRHYSRDKAIVLACFGSVIEQEYVSSTPSRGTEEI